MEKESIILKPCYSNKSCNPFTKLYARYELVKYKFLLYKSDKLKN